MDGLVGVQSQIHSPPTVCIDERRHPVTNIVADSADVFDRFAFGIIERPIIPLQPGYEGALVAASHRHQQECAGCELFGELLRSALSDVDADFAHRVNDLRMHAVTGLRLASPVSATG